MDGEFGCHRLMKDHVWGRRNSALQGATDSYSLTCLTLWDNASFSLPVNM